MNDDDRDIPPELRGRWREWVDTEPTIDEREFRRQLLSRMPDRHPRPRARLLLVAAAASIVAVLIGFESLRGPSRSEVFERSPVVHELGANTILILREDGEPIQVVIDMPENESGGAP
jgi:hypothetical protein